MLPKGAEGLAGGGANAMRMPPPGLLLALGSACTKLSGTMGGTSAVIVTLVPRTPNHRKLGKKMSPGSDEAPRVASGREGRVQGSWSPPCSMGACVEDEV